jgi:hypothetical protein
MEKKALAVSKEKTRGRPDTKIMGVVNDPVLKRYGQKQHVAPGDWVENSNAAAAAVAGVV